MALPKSASNSTGVNSHINLDNILEKEIGLGKYQFKGIALCALIMFFYGFSLLSYVFIAARINTRCKIPECEADTEQEFLPSWVANALPASEHSFDGCSRFAPAISPHNASPGSCPEDLFDRNSVIECSEYIYEHKNSAVYEFNLACDEGRWFLIGSSLVVGTWVSLLLTGLISDHWGRRITLSFTTFNFAWINTLTYWAGSYTTFVLGGFLGSLFGGSSQSCALILVIENVAPKHRMVTVSIMLTCLALGSIAQGLVASMEPYWRHLILIVYLPGFVAFSFYWIVPESVRWLISKNRYEEAKVILIKAAEMNGKMLSEETLKSFSEGNSRIVAKGESQSNLVCLLIKHKIILLRCMITHAWWITIVFVNQGLMISAVVISGNKYLNFIAAAAVPIPALWSSNFFIDRYGRKPILFGMLWTCGACQLAYILIPKGSFAISLSLYLLSKFCITIATSAMYVYTAELVPTNHRSSLVMFSSMIGRIGAFIAPLTPALASEVWEHLPFALFSGLSFLSGLLVSLTPETLGTTLPDSMEDAANLGDNTPSRLQQILRRFVFRRKCYTINR